MGARRVNDIMIVSYSYSLSKTESTIEPVKLVKAKTIYSLEFISNLAVSPWFHHQHSKAPSAFPMKFSIAPFISGPPQTQFPSRFKKLTKVDTSTLISNKIPLPTATTEIRRAPATAPARFLEIQTVLHLH
jgi:hypothetical protein